MQIAGHEFISVIHKKFLQIVRKKDKTHSIKMDKDIRVPRVNPND